MRKSRQPATVALNEAQRERLEHLWSLYGNRGRKTTPGDHQFIQCLLEHVLDIRPRQTKRTERREVPTAGCVAAVEKVLAPNGDEEDGARFRRLRLVPPPAGGRQPPTPDPEVKRLIDEMRRRAAPKRDGGGDVSGAYIWRPAVYRKLMLLLVVLLVAAWPVAGQAQSPPANQWEAEISKFEESDRAQPPPRGAVLFVGSSSVRLWRSLAEDFPGVSVINRGFGGSQIADSTLYAGRIVVPYKPRMVVLYAGDNDLAAGKTPQQVFEDYKAFVARVRRDLPKAKIAFISIKPSPARAALLPKIKEANGLIRDYAAKNKRLAYIDVFTPMLGTDGSPRPELFGPDMLHMNREGYRLWVSAVAPHLR